MPRSSPRPQGRRRVRRRAGAVSATSCPCDRPRAGRSPAARAKRRGRSAGAGNQARSGNWSGSQSLESCQLRVRRGAAERGRGAAERGRGVAEAARASRAQSGAGAGAGGGVQTGAGAGAPAYCIGAGEGSGAAAGTAGAGGAATGPGAGAPRDFRPRSLAALGRIVCASDDWGNWVVDCLARIAVSSGGCTPSGGRCVSFG